MMRGLRRFPLVTAVVFAVTATVNLVQLTTGGLLAELQRTSAGLHGDWWRSGTSLFVQDGWVAGTVVNLVFLVLVGVLAEQVLSRPHWLLQYFGVGLATEVLAYAWQPTGGGNSIAVCGLTGAVVVALWHGDSRLPDWAILAVVFWSGVLIASLGGYAYLLTVVVCGASPGLVRLGRQRGKTLERPVAVGVLIVAVVLAMAQNIHGAALLLGIALAVAVLRLTGSSSTR